MAGELGVEGSLHSCPCCHPFTQEPSRDPRAWAQTLPSTVPGQDVVLLIRGAQEGEGEASTGPSPGLSCREVLKP